jgi:hypothetical protein
LLVSEQGQALVQSRDFLAGPVLVGGDVPALPGELAPIVEGCYERSRCELGSRQNANERPTAEQAARLKRIT